MCPWIDAPCAGRNRTRSTIWLVFGLLLTGSAVPLYAAVADEDDRVEQFLGRLGLVELQTLQLEQRVAAASEPSQQLALAIRLADLYAGNLIASADNKEKQADWLRRIQGLVEKVPQAKSPALEVMLLQADYQRAESLAGAWLSAPDNSSAHGEAAAILDRIAPQLDQRQQQLQAELDKLLGALEELNEGDQRRVKENEAARLKSVVGRAAYFAAWSNYYLARLRPDSPQAQTALARARDIFLGILGIDGDYAGLESEMLGLESIWRARALIGLGLSEAALGNLPGSRACFDLLESPSVSSDVREQAPCWRLESLLSTGQYAAALQFARSRVEAFSGSPTQAKVSFCVSLVRAARPRPDLPAEARQLGALGIAGLVKLRQLRALRELIDKYQIAVEGTSGFYLRWARGQQLFEAAERSKSADDYRAAADELAAAIAAEEAKQDLGAAAQCRFILGWCWYRLERLEDAARAFEQSVPGLQAIKDSNAAQAAWMAFVSYAALAKTQSRFVSSATDALNRIKREFPEHAYAQRADYYLGKLSEQSSSPAETLARLEGVPATAPNYLDARYDICRLRYRQWSEAPAEDRAKAAPGVLAAADVYLAAAPRDGDPAREVQCCLWAAEVADSRNDAAASQADAYLEKAAARVASLPPGHSAAAEFHYRQLVRAGRRGDAASRVGEASWLVQHAPGSPYEIPALVIAAKGAEEAIASADETRRAALQQEAYQAYRRLSERLGDSPEVLSSQKNAQVACSKSAHFALLSGRPGEAAEKLDRLLKAFPDNRDYLRRAGLAHFQAGSYAQALVAWRTLLAGLEKGSEDWFEAKYYQLSCLFRTDENAARQVWQQFKLLHPELGPPAWRERFGEFNK